MLTIACCSIVGLGLGLIRFSVWLVSGYAHVFVLLSVVIVTLPIKFLNHYCSDRSIYAYHDSPSVTGSMLVVLVGSCESFDMNQQHSSYKHI